MEHTLNSLNGKCRFTGTNGHPVYSKAQCEPCTFSVDCQAELNFNVNDLEKAKEMYVESTKLIADGEELKKLANTIFAQELKQNNILKFQFDNLSISEVHVSSQNTYPKANLLKTFTIEQLAPACEIKPAYTYVLVKDLLKEKKSKDNG